MGLAAAGLAEEQDRPAGVHEPQGREVIDEFAVDGGLELGKSKSLIVLRNGNLA